MMDKIEIDNKEAAREVLRMLGVEVDDSADLPKIVVEE